MQRGVLVKYLYESKLLIVKYLSLAKYISLVQIMDCQVGSIFILVNIINCQVFFQIMDCQVGSMTRRQTNTCFPSFDLNQEIWDGNSK